MGGPKKAKKHADVILNWNLTNQCQFKVDLFFQILLPSQNIWNEPNIKNYIFLISFLLIYELFVFVNAQN